MNKTMLYGLHDKPPHTVSLVVAFQHTLAVFGGIVAAPLIIAGGMGLSLADKSYLLSAALIISGVATFIQVSRFGFVGSGLLSIQGTSFTFIGPLITAYFLLLNQSNPSISLGAIFGTSAACAVTVGLCAQFVERMKLVISANVTGTTVMLIGASLVYATGNNIFSEYESLNAASGNGGLAILLSGVALAVTLLLAFQKHPIVKMTSITVGLLVGFLFANLFGLIDFGSLKDFSTIQIPEFSRYPLSFDLAIYFALLPIFFISSMESMGDLTATSSLSKIRIGSADYWSRVRGGVTGDALNSVIASVFCTFPNTSFSQNNGVIRLTGVCSPFVGKYVALMLGLLGFFPIVSGIFLLVPNSVLYGATLLMFVFVFLSGVAIVQANADSDAHRWWVVGLSLSLAIVLSQVISGMNFLPEWLIRLFSFPISNGAIIAIFVEIVRLWVKPGIRYSET